MRTLRIAVVVIALLFAPATAVAQQKQPTAIGTGGAAASVDPLATQAAIDALRSGLAAAEPVRRGGGSAMVERP